MRRLYKKLILSFIVPFLILVLTEFSLRLFDYGKPVSYFLNSNSNNDILIENTAFPYRFLPKNLARNPQPVAFKRNKNSDTIRIFIFGESAAAGDPEYAFSMGRLLERILETRFLDLDFEVINTAVTALNSHSILSTAKDCVDLNGDFWIVYMGHNEVMGPFGAGTIFGNKTPSINLLKTGLYFKKYRLGQWLSSFNTYFEPNISKNWGGMKMFIDQKIGFDDEKLKWVYSAFESNTKEILHYAHQANVKVILSTAASNLRDSAPFASLGNGISQNAQEAFNKAKQLEHIGDIKEARKYYLQALDLDALRFRTDSNLRNITINAARDTEADVVIIDAQAELDKLSPNGISGHEFFFEHVHFTFRGNYNISMLFADRIANIIESNGITANGEWLTIDNCMKTISYTDWDKMLVYSIIEKRIQQPPFNHRSDNEISLKRIQSEISKIKVVQDNDRDINNYKYSISSRPNDWRLSQRLALLYAEVGLFDESLLSIKHALKYIDHNAVLNYQHAAILNKLKFYKDAKIAADKALMVNPDLSDAIYQSALASKGNRDYNAANKLFEKCIQLDPSFKNAYIEWGMMYEINQQTNNATRVYKKALNIFPYQSEINYRMGVSHKTLGNHELALKYFQNAAKHSNNAEANFQIGVYHVNREQYKKAINSFYKAVSIKPDFSYARFNLGVGLIKIEKFNDATKEFEKLTNDHPENQEFLKYLNYSRSKLLNK